MIVQFIKHLATTKFDYVIAAPTNKAVKNIELLARTNTISIKATTLAKLLNLQPEIDNSKGDEIFVVREDKEISQDIILVDEYSMISSENLKMLDSKTPRSKIIFVGDPAQLPPVGEKKPPVESFPLVRIGTSLSEVVRYDGAIAHIAEQIRSESKYDHILYPYATTKDESITCLSRDKWTNQACEFIKSEEFKKNPNHARILVWRNRTADKLNDMVRSYLWGKDCKPFEVGDLLIAKTPVFRKVTDSKKQNWVIMINNSEECRVMGLGEIESTEMGIFMKKHTFEYFSVPVLSEGGTKMNLRILTPKSKARMDEVKKETKDYILKSPKASRGKLWVQYYNLDRSFDNTPFAYSLTTHKAQGSSIDHVFLATYDLRGCPDLQKIQYTAFTRAVNKVWTPLL